MNAGSSSKRIESNFSTASESGPSSHGEHFRDWVETPTAASTDNPSQNGLSLESWCPHAISLILDRFSPMTADYLFSLPRKPAALRDHSACTQARCTANDTQLMEGGRYISAHWNKCTGGTRCTFLGPNSEQVRDIIESGGIPLISIKEGDGGDLYMDVVKATSMSKYVAVSHVWSGGLGNPHENSLPRCQVRRLFDMWPELTYESESISLATDRVKYRTTISTLFRYIEAPYWYGVFAAHQVKKRWPSLRPQENLYWIDTLCIPLGQEFFDLKMRAINSMAQIYANAEAIIILDHELQQTKHRDMPYLDILGLLACSAWNTRAWTFQEGAMAKKWLVQFEDGIWGLHRHVVDDSWGEVELQLRDFLAEVPQIYSIGGQKRFDESSFEKRYSLFLEVWNGLCTRSTTKRDDLLSIIAILLGFRPAEIIRLPADARIISLLCAQDVLPFSFVWRKRPVLQDWSEAHYWLPATIEEVPTRVTDGVLWRRSRLENFFILKLSPSYCEQLRFYFTRTPGELYGSTFKLRDESTREEIIVTLQVSSNLALPQLDVCFVIEMDVTEGHACGACLGIRHRDAESTQIYYICQIKCAFIPPTGDEIQTISNATMSVMQEDMTAIKDIALEHDFSKAIILAESRPFLSDEERKIYRTILEMPFYLYIGVYILLVYVSKVFREDEEFSWWVIFAEIGIGVARCLLFLGEMLSSMSDFRAAEFDEWYSGLYGDNIILADTAFYVHYRPSIVYFILALGLLSTPVFWLPSYLPWEQFRLNTAWAVEREVAILLVRWLLELCAVAAPRIINLPLRLVSNTSSWTRQGQKSDWYFRRFYSKSRVTTFLERVLRTQFSAMNSLTQELPRDSYTEDMRTTFAQTNEVTSTDVPWELKNVKILEPCTEDQNLRFKNSLSTLTVEGEVITDLDAAFRYLSELLVVPYFIVVVYWGVSVAIFFILIILGISPPNHFRLYGLRSPENVMFFSLFMFFSWVIRTLLVRSAVDAPLDAPIHSKPRYSIHFGAITTVILFCISIPIFLDPIVRPLPPLPDPLPWMPPGAILIRFPRSRTACFCAALSMGNVALLWMLELIGHYEITMNLRGKLSFLCNGVGKGNEAIDECSRRLYSKSRFTRWVEGIFGLRCVGFVNWWRLVTTRRQRDRRFYAENEERRPQARIGRDYYTDDGDEDPEGDMLLLE